MAPALTPDPEGQASGIGTGTARRYQNPQKTPANCRYRPLHAYQQKPCKSGLSSGSSRPSENRGVPSSNLGLAIALCGQRSGYVSGASAWMRLFPEAASIEGGTAGPSAPLCACAGLGGIAWREAPALLRGHLPDHEPARGDLLADVLQLLFVLLLLAQLVGTRHCALLGLMRSELAPAPALIGRADAWRRKSLCRKHHALRGLRRPHLSWNQYKRTALLGRFRGRGGIRSAARRWLSVTVIGGGRAFRPRGQLA